MRWSREEYIELMTFGKVQRQMFVELFGPLVGLEDEWKAQGALQDELDMTGFDWDYVPVMNCGGNTNIRGGFSPRIIEDTSEYSIRTNSWGAKEKLIKSTVVNLRKLHLIAHKINA
jgi:hypothetical protein